MSRVEGRVYTDDHTRVLHVTEKPDGTLELIADANDHDVVLSLDPRAVRNLRLLLVAYERSRKR